MIFTIYDLYFMVPAILITLWAQYKVKHAYSKYSQIGVRSGVTGADIARRMMQVEGVRDIGLERIPGQMTDHFDPRARVVRLSEDVYHGRSIAALGIAAHEIGHVIQDARGYAPMRLRHLIYPISSFGSGLAPILVMIGFALSFGGSSPLGNILMHAGIYLFAAAVAFTFITLPVEFNASRRAMLALAEGQVMTQEELRGARAVLNAAALTYVAAAAVAVLQLLRFVMLARSRD